MTSGRDIDRTILHLAEQTAGVVHARDLRRAGIGRNPVARRVSDGWLGPLVRRTYAVGPGCRAPSFEQRCMAGVLDGGPTAAVDGAAAATLVGVWQRGVTTIDVTRRGCAQRPASGYAFHEHVGIWLPERRAIPVVPFTWMCLRMAGTHTPWQLASAIDRGVHLGLVFLDELTAFVDARLGDRHVRTLRQAVALVLEGSCGTRGAAEDRLLGSIVAAGVRVPIVNTRGALGLNRDEPDFVWPDRRLNVEVDGRHHEREPQRTDDRLRDAQAAELGWSVARVPARTAYHRPGRVVRWIAAALAREAAPVDPATRRMVLGGR